jgi:hypothetical protein
VSDTKKAFIETYPKPIPSVYEAVVQELLVQQHFIRYKVNYQYNEVSAEEHLPLKNGRIYVCHGVASTVGRLIWAAARLQGADLF